MSGFKFGKQVLLYAMLFITSWQTPTMATAETKAREDRIVISPKKTIVQVYNKLGDDFLNLTIHCKSKDDDLGTHTIANNDYFYWKFRVSFFGKTLFFCELSWRDGSGVYDIYKTARDFHRCPTKCDWEVLKDGVHGIRQGDNVNDIFFKWS
ncbi:hypothetical protein FEM48_Zijuj07G0077900 [Ziziphus jujuba var. spinosa]|uniref:S-protein homolog n=1 Tax=Ziziphus jujuba var. spinosa TaxID=714518 RepID=A0A978V3D7_ZIZJJ|nr:hypothetical protein FEM48_Zijuj07G0077900 [Ziziphus jujuba var. spinosa]